MTTTTTGTTDTDTAAVPMTMAAVRRRWKALLAERARSGQRKYDEALANIVRALDHVEQATREALELDWRKYTSERLSEPGHYDGREALRDLRGLEWTLSALTGMSGSMVGPAVRAVLEGDAFGSGDDGDA